MRPATVGSALRGTGPTESWKWAPLLRDRHEAHRRGYDYFLYEGAGVGGATLKRHATWRVTKTKKPPGDEVRPDVAVATPLLYVSPKPPPPPVEFLHNDNIAREKLSCDATSRAENKKRTPRRFLCFLHFQNVTGAAR